MTKAFLRPRPVRVAFLVNEHEHWRSMFDAIMAYSYGRWGGRFSLLIPLDKRAGADRLTCSFDMLGEGARTLADADRYEADYATAISAIAATGRLIVPEQGHGVSVKLSALDCRYEATKESRAIEML